MEYEFTQDWFSWNIPTWDSLLKNLTPRQRFLEIGCFEGRSTVWMLESGLEDGGTLISIDTFEGGFEHSTETMSGVEERFRRNVKIAQDRRKDVHHLCVVSTSTNAMAKLLANTVELFDFIYIDGSHSGPDVLSDAVMAFHLCRVGGMIAFDDYLWGHEWDLIERPKLAIDSFVNLYAKKLRIVLLGSQLWVQKTEN